MYVLLFLTAGCSTPPPPTAPDPGRVAMRRLNRTEYDNTVRDLLGTASTPARDFPADPSTGGWDHISGDLSVSPLQVELYELAAQHLAAEVVAAPTEPLSIRIEGEGPETIASAGSPHGDAWRLVGEGSLSADITAPLAGRYTLSARVWSGPEGPATLALGSDGALGEPAEALGTSPEDAAVVSLDLDLSSGPHTIGLSLLRSDDGPDRELFVDWLAAEGPAQIPPPDTRLRERLIRCDPADDGARACAEETLLALAPRAWRQPVSAAELAGLLGVIDEILASGGTFDDALQVGLAALLTSPRFVYHIELDRSPPGAGDLPQPLSPYELASRLSYFLWRSMPDEALFAAAARNELSTRAQISAQVRRMLADPKAASLTDDFAGQWLYLRGIDEVDKGPTFFPTFDDALRASMREEARRFFASFVASDRDTHELLTATSWEIDEVLAEHYGLTLPRPGWQPVDLSATGRRGVLGQAGLLAVTSYPTRTSPVVRGKFVLGQLLCSEPPPPPPGVEGLSDAPSEGTLRDQLEAHRTDPACAACHVEMDSIGLGLENFDGIGTWRETDGDDPIDPSGALSGVPFEGPTGLVALLADDPRFERCLVEQTFAYALGRLPEASDVPSLDAIEARFVRRGASFRALVEAIATSEPFTTRGAPR